MKTPASPPSPASWTLRMVCAASLAASPLGFAEESLGEEEREPTVGELKAQYLACDAATRQRMLGFAEAAACSVVSETLLHRGFEGDFNALLAWWRQAKDRAEPETVLD
jgi:hypothetical protein